MLNEPLGELGELEGEMGAIGDESPQMNYIQVTPQEKEAIERVRTVRGGEWRSQKGVGHCTGAGLGGVGGDQSSQRGGMGEGGARRAALGLWSSGSRVSSCHW